MLGEVQYGGRVTDDFDKRLLNTFCRVWFHENMFGDSFKFYQGYKIPKCSNLNDFKAHIDELPMVDSPEVTIYQYDDNIFRIHSCFTFSYCQGLQIMYLMLNRYYVGICSYERWLHFTGIWIAS